ncbi:aldo/keto reductase [Zavarzinella formosa]|uniref:aldo/keto reductase n=1 Tax=Zavarzinella formosa TaxID=360055 RepID=UPI00031EA947|nr:aldo/keto reductase [Zavarzinella formosa]
MNFRTLGKTGITVSEIGLGGLFTSGLGPGFEESKRAVFKALDLGINYIDTAPGYADSEAVLGRILREVKTPIVLSTKLGGRPLPFNPQNADELRRSVEESLKLLGREVIDVLIIHEPDRPLQYNWWTEPERCYGPVIEVLNDLKKRGVIRFTGLGGTTTTEMSHYLRAGDFDVLLTAFNYSAAFQEATRELLPEAIGKKMGIVLGSVLQQGALGRRYDEVLKKKPAWLSKPRQEQLRQFYDILDRHQMPIVEACIRFVITNPDISTALIGAKTATQIEESVTAAAKGPLALDLLSEINQMASMVPFRPFEEPMILPFNKPDTYWGPGLANLASGIPVGKGVL